MKKLIYVAVLMIAFISSAQEKKQTKRKRRYQPKQALKVDASELDAFNMEGYDRVTFAYGDFNGDALYDAVILFKKTDEASLSLSESTPIERPLLVLLRNAKGELYLKSRNDRAVYCYKCGSDYGSPITDILIEGNQFIIQHESGKANRWTRLLTFEYDALKQHFYLVKDATSTYSLSKVKDIENEVKTMKDFGFIPFKGFDVYASDLKLKKS